MRYLSETHQIELEGGSAILPEIIDERGYYTAKSDRQ